MELKNLTLVKTIAKEGSLIKAANQLHLSQSALSHQLKAMESELGTPLFHRISKKMVLTPAGKIVLESAKGILKEVDNLETRLKQCLYGDVGTLRLSTECYTCYYWLPSLMQEYTRLFPNIDIRIISEATGHPIPYLINGELDLALISGKVDSKNLNAEFLLEDELVAVVPVNHPWSKSKSVSGKKFAEENLIIYNIPLEETLFYQKVLNPSGTMPKKVMKIQVTEAIVEMIKAGLGVGVMASWAVKPYVKMGGITTVSLTRGGLMRPWFAVTLKQNRPPKYLKSFIDFLSENFHA